MKVYKYVGPRKVSVGTSVTYVYSTNGKLTPLPSRYENLGTPLRPGKEDGVRSGCKKVGMLSV